MTLATRPATSTDTAFARTTHHLAYREAVERQFGPWNEADQDRFFASGWKPEKNLMLLHNRELCGYTQVEEHPHQISVCELVIHPQFQNHGVGTALLRQVMDKARSLGIPVRLGTFKTNRARKLYERLGFREFDQTATHVL